MNLPRLSDLKVKGKKVLLRLDLDVPLEKKGDEVTVKDNTRLKAAVPTIKYLLGSEAEQIIIMGHIGRPQEDLKKTSTFCLMPELISLLDETVSYWPDAIKEGSMSFSEEDGKVHILENLRFDPGEEKNDPEFAKKLASLGDVYVNEAFAVCHREAASIVGLPKLMPHAAGLNLAHEIEMLSKVLDNPSHPIIAVIGGGKFDKVLLVDKLLNNADYVLVGGVLPEKVKSYCRQDAKICVSAAHLTHEGKDITPDSARNFAEIIKTAKTIIWNGPMGDIDSGYWDGTEIVANAIAESTAYKVAGGGDTLGMLSKLGIEGKIDYVSTGGGAFLEFLSYGDLPGIVALRNN